MADLLLKSISPELLAGLKSRAESHGLSPEAEALAILEREFPGHDRKTLAAELRAFRESLGPGPFSDSTAILQAMREDRFR